MQVVVKVHLFKALRSLRRCLPDFFIQAGARNNFNYSKQAFSFNKTFSIE